MITATCDHCGTDLVLVIKNNVKVWGWYDSDGGYTCPANTEPDPNDGKFYHHDSIAANIRRYHERN